jgi:hypothetical protein
VVDTCEAAVDQAVFVGYVEGQTGDKALFSYTPIEGHLLYLQG